MADDCMHEVQVPLRLCHFFQVRPSQTAYEWTTVYIQGVLLLRGTRERVAALFGTPACPVAHQSEVPDEVLPAGCFVCTPLCSNTRLCRMLGRTETRGHTRVYALRGITPCLTAPCYMRRYHCRYKRVVFAQSNIFMPYTVVAHHWYIWHASSHTGCWDWAQWHSTIFLFRHCQLRQHGGWFGMVWNIPKWHIAMDML